jgi:hypothetical protein
MPKNEDKVLDILNGHSLCDDCLAHQWGIEPRQAVNAICRRKVAEGILLGSKSRCPLCGGFKIVNHLRKTHPKPAAFALENLHPVFQPIEFSSHSWYWEGNVQSCLDAWFQSQGYTILQSADTSSRKQGVDLIIQHLVGGELLVTVKGYPRKAPICKPATGLRALSST